MVKYAIIYMHNFLKGVQSMKTKIGRIRKMIETYVKNPNKDLGDYHAVLAKCSRLDELDARLNELENQGRPKDPEEAALFRNEIDDIGNEVRGLTSPMKEAI